MEKSNIPNALLILLFEPFTGYWFLSLVVIAIFVPMLSKAFNILLGKKWSNFLHNIKKKLKL
jgi:hypothetical protein